MNSTMTATEDALAELRDQFPGWSVFQSAGDEPQFYATPHRAPNHGGYEYTLCAETVAALGVLVNSHILGDDVDGNHET